MNITIVKHSATELILTQKRKLTVAGSFFGLPVIVLFSWPGLPVFFWLASCMLLWMIIFQCFYKGVTYTIKANKTKQAFEITVKGIFRKKQYKLNYPDIYHIIMAESNRFMQRSDSSHFHLIIEGSNNKRIKIFGFTNRRYCKQTASLIESYL